ncbi:MAG: hypothetical protein IJY04_10395 [Clostridia bacterium]|nr:hypothetical protein [Clostridia bacterium]
MENVSRNLFGLRQRDISVSERRMAHIDEAARALTHRYHAEGFPLESGEFREEYRRFATGLVPEEGCLSDDVPEENRARVLTDISEDAVNSGIFPCAAICEEQKKAGRPLEFPSFFPDSDEQDGDARIAYLRNPYSDTAYRVFSDVIEKASVTYPRDFTSVCEEVYYGRCRYCILPIETSDEGGLSGFRRLVSKYELCPILSCSVSSGGGSQTTRSALFSKNIERLSVSGNPLVKTEREVFSFRLNAPEETSLMKTIKAMHIYGLRLLKVDSTPVSWDEGRYSFEFYAECDGGNISAMLLYLELEIPEYTPIGYYSQIVTRQ